jgi:hypothetical protein
MLVLTHVLTSDCSLNLGMVSDLVEKVGVDDQITLGTSVPTYRHYPAGTLVYAGLAHRLIEAGYVDDVVPLSQPVVAAALEGDDPAQHLGKPFQAWVYSLPCVEADEEEMDTEFVSEVSPDVMEWAAEQQLGSERRFTVTLEFTATALTVDEADELGQELVQEAVDRWRAAGAVLKVEMCDE